ncbi:hypothetical protein HY492_01235 [Candidatus Woesearchaeota archaeon]|nr:hypothetical protein [Candidatus Woesearchaeota archaeon]
MALIYATSFPLLRDCEMEQVIGELGTWIASSPHRGITFAELPGMLNGDINYAKGKISIETANFQKEGCRHFGLNLTEVNGALRRTHVVAHKTPTSFNIAITHDVATTNIGDGIGQMSKPRIVNDLIDKVGGGYDGMALKVSTRPEYLTKDDVQFVSEILQNKTDNKLPVVYVSCARDKPQINADELAKKLGGMAHVLVEPSVSFSYDLSRLMERRNAYNGAVSVCWPNGDRPKFYSVGGMLEELILKHIHERSFYQVLPADVTFDGIKNLQTRETIERLRAEKAMSVDEALDFAAQEGERYERQVKDLLGKIAFLETRLRQQSPQGNLLVSVSNPELYAREIYDIAVAALDHYLRNVHADSRKEDILKALLNANPSTGGREIIVEELNRIFKSAGDKFTSEMQRDLERLGFEVTHGGKHYLLTIPGQGRKNTIPATPGDFRSFKNNLSEIKNNLL